MLDPILHFFFTATYGRVLRALFSIQPLGHQVAWPPYFGLSSSREHMVMSSVFHLFFLHIETTFEQLVIPLEDSIQAVTTTI